MCEYCRERDKGVDGEEFWNFYESKGWVVGKAPMKNWKASVGTWEQKRKQDSRASPVGQNGAWKSTAQRRLESNIAAGEAFLRGETGLEGIFDTAIGQR